MYNFGRGHYEENLCKSVFEYGSVVQEMTIEVIFYFSSSGHFVHRRRTVCAIRKKTYLKSFALFKGLQQHDMLSLSFCFLENKC